MKTEIKIREGMASAVVGGVSLTTELPESNYFHP